MAWTDFQARSTATDRVKNIVHALQQVHAIAVNLRDARALYIAGTDPTFNQVFDALMHTAGDRSEVNGMIVQLTALAITDWEAAHAALLGLP